MPELPEVETIRRALQSQVQGIAFSKITLRRKDLRFVIPSKLPRVFSGAKIQNLDRRSKYLLFHCDNGFTMILHLGMSGRLFFTEAQGHFHKHDHVIFDLKDGKHLRFRDPRRFGFLDYTQTDKLNEHAFFKHLGPEPLQKHFNAQYLYERLKKSNAPIKSLLMNAQVVVGVGNIYANEALFDSQISPLRKGKEIQLQECERLVSDVRAVLKRSIESGGTSFRDYVNIDQEPGLHQLSLRVYGKENQNCVVCHTKIKREVQTGRSSFYCPTCQN